MRRSSTRVGSGDSKKESDKAGDEEEFAVKFNVIPSGNNQLEPKNSLFKAFDLIYSFFQEPQTFPPRYTFQFEGKEYPAMVSIYFEFKQY